MSYSKIVLANISRTVDIETKMLEMLVYTYSYINHEQYYMKQGVGKQLGVAL